MYFTIIVCWNLCYFFSLRKKKYAETTNTITKHRQCAHIFRNVFLRRIVMIFHSIRLYIIIFVYLSWRWYNVSFYRTFKFFEISTEMRPRMRRKSLRYSKRKANKMLSLFSIPTWICEKRKSWVFSAQETGFLKHFLSYRIHLCIVEHFKAKIKTISRVNGK